MEILKNKTIFFLQKEKKRIQKTFVWVLFWYKKKLIQKFFLGGQNLFKKKK